MSAETAFEPSSRFASWHRCFASVAECRRASATARSTRGGTSARCTPRSRNAAGQCHRLRQQVELAARSLKLHAAGFRAEDLERETPSMFGVIVPECNACQTQDWLAGWGNRAARGLECSARMNAIVRVTPLSARRDAIISPVGIQEVIGIATASAASQQTDSPGRSRVQSDTGFDRLATVRSTSLIRLEQGNRRIH